MEEETLAGLLDSLDLETVLEQSKPAAETPANPPAPPREHVRSKSPDAAPKNAPFTNFTFDGDAGGFLPKSKTAPAMQVPEYLMSCDTNEEWLAELPMMTTAPTLQPFLASSLNSMAQLQAELSNLPQELITSLTEGALDLGAAGLSEAYTHLQRQASAPATLVSGHIASGRVTMTNPELPAGNDEFEHRLAYQQAPATAAPAQKRKGGNRSSGSPSTTPPQSVTPPQMGMHPGGQPMPSLPLVPGMPSPMDMFAQLSHLSQMSNGLIDQNQLLAMAVAHGLAIPHPVKNAKMSMVPPMPPPNGAHLIATPQDLNEDDEAAAKKKRARKRRKNKKRVCFSFLCLTSAICQEQKQIDGSVLSSLPLDEQNRFEGSAHKQKGPK
ncbi:hypothetical protein DIPPA_16222 [Diplonema papillatum]|nr:hypothetical protein DIPPA_16222 [Diplonema papillatum]